MNTSWQLLLSGIPLTSTRGALGWSSVTLVRAAGRTLLVDSGAYPGMTGLLLEDEQVLIAGDGIKNGREFFSRQFPPVFASQEDALLSYDRARQIARVIIPGHDNPFRIPIRDDIEYLEYYSLDITFAGAPGVDPQTIHLP